MTFDLYRSVCWIKSSFSLALGSVTLSCFAARRLKLVLTVSCVCVCLCDAVDSLWVIIFIGNDGPPPEKKRKSEDVLGTFTAHTPHTHTLMHVRTHMDSHMHAHTPHMHTCTHTHTPHTYMHDAHTHTHAHMHSHTPHTHTCTPAHTHTHAHSHKIPMS